MDEQEVPIAAAATAAEQETKASPPATSAEDVQQPSSTDIPPPSHAPEPDNVQSDSAPMEVDQQQAPEEEPQKMQ